MKPGWEVKTLGELCEILDRLRKPITKRNRVSGPYPYYGATGVLDHVEGYLFDEMLVLLGEDGAKWEPGANSAFSIEGKTWVNNHAHVMRPNREILDDNWLIYYLNFSDLMPYVSGMTVPKLNQGSLREIPIPLPPLDEQKRIVSILDEAFEGLDRARENAEANLKSARELFESGLDALFATIRLPQYQTSIGSFSKVFDGPHATPKTIEKGPVFLGISSLVDGSLDLRKTRHVSDLDYLTWTKRVEPKARDVVFSYETRLGQAAIIPEGLKCCLGRRMGLVRLETDKVMPKFFLFQYLTPTYQKFLRSKVVEGATVDRIHLKHFPNFPMFVPPIETQQAVIKRLEEFLGCSDKVTSGQASKLQDISDLRQSLLQKAFAGELT
ncbi:restriction endonuclease subunit S [Paracoccaceae bacterium]|nr:restriction endonuclease subunit S [Paracoccaceae bacterium]